jgi:hypothetical protein
MNELGENNFIFPIRNPSLLNPQAVFRIWIQIWIRIHRIHEFLGDPDPLVRGTDPDPDPDISKQK